MGGNDRGDAGSLGGFDLKVTRKGWAKSQGTQPPSRSRAPNGDLSPCPFGFIPRTGVEQSYNP